MNTHKGPQSAFWLVVELQSLQQTSMFPVISMHTTWPLPHIFLNLSPSPPPPPFSLLSRCVSPSFLFSSGSVVCFQEIRPLLISHMSRVQLEQALYVCVCVGIPVFVTVCVCVCVCEVAHLRMRWKFEKKTASMDSPSFLHLMLPPSSHWLVYPAEQSLFFLL